MSGKTIIASILLILAIILAAIAVIEFFMLHFIAATIIFIVVTIMAKIGSWILTKEKKEKEERKIREATQTRSTIHLKSLPESETKKKYFNSAI